MEASAVKNEGSLKEMLAADRGRPCRGRSTSGRTPGSPRDILLMGSNKPGVDEPIGHGIVRNVFL
jgi:hypothetical protein